MHNDGKITLFGDNTYGQCGYRQVIEYNKEYSSILDMKAKMYLR